MARALVDLDQPGAAETLLQKILLKIPDSWEAHQDLAGIYEKTGKKDLALDEYKKAIAILKKQVTNRNK